MVWVSRFAQGPANTSFPWIQQQDLVDCHPTCLLHRHRLWYISLRAVLCLRPCGPSSRSSFPSVKILPGSVPFCVLLCSFAAIPVRLNLILILILILIFTPPSLPSFLAHDLFENRTENRAWLDEIAIRSRDELRRTHLGLLDLLGR